MNKTILMIVGLIAVGGLSFYGGTQMSQTRFPGSMQNGNGDFVSMPGGNFRSQNGTGISPVNGTARRNGNMINGKITAKDDTSITIDLGTAGSKIIFYSNTTKVTKTVDGAVSDLATGETIAVTGTTNSDGSITAGSIQLRPELLFRNSTQQVTTQPAKTESTAPNQPENAEMTPPPDMPPPGL